jgi:hypothetical protein
VVAGKISDSLGKNQEKNIGWRVFTIGEFIFGIGMFILANGFNVILIDELIS